MSENLDQDTQMEPEEKPDVSEEDDKAEGNE
jgi:hypothetical protein